MLSRVDGAREDHGAKRREDDEHVELASLEAVLAKIAARKQRGEPGADANDDIEEQAELIDGQIARDELGRSGNVSADQHGAREGSSSEERRGRDQRELGAFRAEGIDQHDGQTRRRRAAAEATLP